jgi:hypothetical protein
LKTVESLNSSFFGPTRHTALAGGINTVGTTDSNRSNNTTAATSTKSTGEN